MRPFPKWCLLTAALIAALWLLCLPLRAESYHAENPPKMWVPSAVGSAQDDYFFMAGKTVLAGELPEEDLAQIVDLWPAWSSGVSYAVDEIVRHEGSLYKVVQAHTSQADWAPPDVPALFAKITPPGLIAEWVQPTGGHDAYNTGDMVTFEGGTYRSLIDGNVWSPTAYPAGWEEV